MTSFNRPSEKSGFLEEADTGDSIEKADLVACLALWRAPGVGPVTFQSVCDQLDSFQALTEGLKRTDLKLGLAKKATDFLNSKPFEDLVKADLEWLAASPQHHMLIKGYPGYPEQLAELSESPGVLFVDGSLDALETPQVAMVGTRNPTAVGQQMARDFAEALTTNKLTVTSGLALGIDGCAHQGAVKAGGPTLAVLANGLDQIYPKRHQGLAKQIVATGGAIVSEFPVGIAPRREHFPRRNRIISGLSYGVLVVEAAVQSGSLITARLSGQQGREVFAIPGPIHNPMSRGCHQLLREGAVLVENVSDITDVLYPLIERELQAVARPHTAETPNTESAPVQEPVSAPVNLSLAEKMVLDAIEYDVTPLDDLVVKANMTTQEVLTHLMSLELKDQVITTAGGYQKVVSGG